MAIKLSEGYPEVRIDYDRTLLTRFNLSTAGVAQSVRDKVLGNRDVHVPRRRSRRPDGSARSVATPGVDMLRRLNVNPALTPPIPLESVAAFRKRWVQRDPPHRPTAGGGGQRQHGRL